ncbi:hypothetical protein D3C85_1501480 [compost metagenome]
MHQRLLLQRRQLLVGPRRFAGQLLAGFTAVQALAANGLALMVTYQVTGDGEEKGRQVVDLLVGRQPRQAQERFLRQVGCHLRIARAARNKGFQRFLVLGEQAGNLRIPRRHGTSWRWTSR